MCCFSRFGRCVSPCAAVTDDTKDFCITECPLRLTALRDLCEGIHVNYIPCRSVSDVLSLDIPIINLAHARPGLAFVSEPLPMGCP